MSWNPSVYLAFSDHRLRPAVDLLQRIPCDSPRTIIDLGCGPGNVTRLLALRWPNAQITGADSSPEMLARARHDVPEITWQHADIATWHAEAPVDLLFSNAALHWVDDHARLLPHLAAQLAPGGMMAVQMPRNHHAPSHRLIDALARSARWAERLVPVLRPFPVAAPEDYWQWLRPHLATLDLWETVYYHPLTGSDPVLHWVTGTTLRPLLAVLSAEEQAAFLADLGAQLRDAYPPQPDGVTLLPFRRLFLVGQR